MEKKKKSNKIIIGIVVFLIIVGTAIALVLSGALSFEKPIEEKITDEYQQENYENDNIAAAIYSKESGKPEFVKITVNPDKFGIPSAALTAAKAASKLISGIDLSTDDKGQLIVSVEREKIDESIIDKLIDVKIIAPEDGEVYSKLLNGSTEDILNFLKTLG